MNETGFLGSDIVEFLRVAFQVVKLGDIAIVLDQLVLPGTDTPPVSCPGQ